MLHREGRATNLINQGILDVGSSMLKASSCLKKFAACAREKKGLELATTRNGTPIKESSLSCQKQKPCANCKLCKKIACDLNKI